MLTHGNGTPEQCAFNLLRITRGEVPLDRIKGLDAALIDKPSGTTVSAAVADAEWLIKTYEPRLNADSIDINAMLNSDGDFGITANLMIKGAVDE